MVLAELADFEPEGWYAMTILVFLLPDPTVSQTRFHHLCRETSRCHHHTPTMLIPLHPLIYIVSNNAPSLHANANNIPKLLLLGSLVLICLGLASCQNISVELAAELIQTIDLCAIGEKS
jgi:hypothetical protein